VSGTTLVGFATQGPEHGDAARLRDLLAAAGGEELRVPRRSRVRFALDLTRELHRRRSALVVMEGTGIAGGLPLLFARTFLGVRFVVSTGDAVGPYVGLLRPSLGWLGGIYERLLFRRSAGVIGWTPYITGRAITLGAARSVTIPGWVPDEWPEPEDAGTWRRLRAQARTELGIENGALVIGIAGSLNWASRRGYAYGLELVEAVARISAPRVRALIVGDGDGREKLIARAAELGITERVVFTGRVRLAEVPAMLAAMDIASLPQSVDAVGSFRYSIKLAEYLRAGLPVVTGQIPAAYDLNGGWLWRLPGEGPWSERYVVALAHLLDGLDDATLAARRDAVPRRHPAFDRADQLERARAFLRELGAG
jgi:glycosyltransferase involved in cell wall biosynthesis